jgi:DNA modification methylase
MDSARRFSKHRYLTFLLKKPVKYFLLFFSLNSYIGAINMSGESVINLYINSRNANAAQNSIKRRLNAIKEPITGIHNDVVMYWAQARNDPNGSKAGDRARIESIYGGEVKVKFINDHIKLKMLYEEPHPFSKAF